MNFWSTFNETDDEFEELFRSCIENNGNTKYEENELSKKEETTIIPSSKESPPTNDVTKICSYIIPHINKDQFKFDDSKDKQKNQISKKSIKYSTRKLGRDTILCWLIDHRECPYPNKKLQEEWCRRFHFSKEYLKNLLINERRRKVRNSRGKRIRLFFS